jgi:hypothetical protein
MLGKPVKEISGKIDTVASDVKEMSDKIARMAAIGMVAFTLISIVAIVALARSIKVD